jgi:hypothetical protein
MLTEDLLITFVAAFEDVGAPPTGWLERASRAGGDPLRASWGLSDSPTYLIHLLYLLEHPDLEPARRARQRSWDEPTHPDVEPEDGACHRCAEAIRAVVAEPPSLEQAMSTTRGEVAHRAWASSERGDELLRLAARGGVEPRVVILAMCDCARLAAPFFPEGDEQPLLALDRIERWAQGSATLVDLERAITSADAALAALHASPAPASHAARSARRAAGAAVDAVGTLARAAHIAATNGSVPALLAPEVAEGVAAAFAISMRAEEDEARIPSPTAPELPLTPAALTALAACARAVRARIPALP